MSNIKALSQAWFFIAITYVTALLPWTIITALDFISADWRTVAATRRSGWYHFCFVAVPLPLIISYVIGNWIAEQYTEASAALLGLYVSFVHFLRTAWGLWQIHLFHSWATEAIESMEEMGYMFELRVKRNTTAREKEELRRKSAREKSDLILINNTVIDNQMFHGETQCYIEFHGKSFCIRKDPYGKVPFWKRLLEGTVITLQLPFLPFLWILELVHYEMGRLFHDENVPSKKKRPCLLQLPYKPVDVWLSWSSVFVSQGLHEWISKFEVAKNPDEDRNVNIGSIGEGTYKKRLYEARRDYFAGEVLAGMCHLNENRELKERTNVSLLWDQWNENSELANGVIKKRELLEAACRSGKSLPFKAVQIVTGAKRDIVEGLEGGEDFQGYRQYDKKLEWVVDSLPVTFGDEVKDFDIEKLEWLTILLHLGYMKKKKKSEEDDQGKGSRRYESRDSYHRPEPKDKISKKDDEENQNCHENASSDLQVMTSSENNRPDLGARGDTQENERNVVSVERHHSTEKSPEKDEKDIFKRIELEDDSVRVCPEERYLPFQNLLSQLGFDNDFTSEQVSTEKRNRETANTGRIRSLSSFPFHEDFASKNCMKVSRVNRNVLIVGELADIWTQLESGKHYEFLQEKNEWWKTGCLWRNILKAEQGDDEIRTDEKKRMAQVQKEAENSRLRYQFGDDKQRYWYLEQTITFMGYAMEYLRTQLAHWVVDQGGEDQSVQVWRPPIRSMKRSNDEKDESLEIGPLSVFLCESMKGIEDTKWFERRSVQVRLLWEAQQLLQEYLNRAMAKAEGGPRSKVAMMLCVLGFPALVLEVKKQDGGEGNEQDPDVDHEGGNCVIHFSRTRNTAKQNKKNMSPWEIRIQAPCAPQDLCVTLVLKKSENWEGRVEVIADLQGCTEDIEHTFEWERWRDSFLCRLEGLRRWQEEHELPSVACCSTSDGIEKGIGTLKMKGMSTGECVRMWKGWKPFRSSICRFEVESPGYILEYMKAEPLTFSRNVQRSKLSFGSLTLNRIERIEVCYWKARWQSLYGCVLVLSQMLRRDHLIRMGDHEIDEIDIQARVDENLRGNQWDRERAVLLLQESAIEGGNEQSLDRCMKLLSEGTIVIRDLERAVNTLNAFITGHKNNESIVMDNRSATAWDIATEYITNFSQNPDMMHELIKLCFFTCEVTRDGSTREAKRLEWLIAVLRKIYVTHRDERHFVQMARTTEYDWRQKEKKLMTLKKEFRIVDARHDECAMQREEHLIQATSREVDDRFIECSHLYACGIAMQDHPYRSLLLNLYGMQFHEGLHGKYQDLIKAKKIFEMAIEKGDSSAMVNLGNLLIKGGEGVEKHPARAKELYELAMKDENCMTAECNLGIILQQGMEGVERDVIRAKEFFEASIRKGNVAAMVALADLMSDDNVEYEEMLRNDRLAKDLYERAITERDYVHAMNNLGLLLKCGGEGVPKDPVRAKALFERAIEKTEDVDAIYNLTGLLLQGDEGVEKDTARAKELLERSIRLYGNPNAMTRLGVILSDDTEGVERDAVRAKHLYERAIVEADHVDAMRHLGSLLTIGDEGVEKDAVRAKELFEKVIHKSEDTLVMVILGNLLMNGADGVDKDAIGAKHLFERAIVEADDVSAMRGLAILLTDGGERVEKDAVRATELYERAIEKAEDADSIFNLTGLLIQGDEGVGKDAARAKELLERSIRLHGNANAMVRLGLLLSEDVEGVEKDTTRAKKLYERCVELHRDPLAIVLLGNLLMSGADGVEKDAVRAKHLYERAIVEADDVNAMRHLALLLKNGDEGVEKDAVRAKELYERIIEKAEDAVSLCMLALLLIQGEEGIEKNMIRAKELLERSIQSNETNLAMTILGYLLVDGAEGIEKDIVRAKQLLERASHEKKSVLAMFPLAAILEQGAEGVQKDLVRSAELYEVLALEHQNAIALESLSKLLENGGEGFAPDAPRAVRVYENLMNGELRVIATKMLANLLENGALGVSVDVERAKKLRDELGEET